MPVLPPSNSSLSASLSPLISHTAQNPSNIFYDLTNISFPIYHAPKPLRITFSLGDDDSMTAEGIQGFYRFLDFSWESKEVKTDVTEEGTRIPMDDNDEMNIKMERESYDSRDEIEPSSSLDTDLDIPVLNVRNQTSIREQTEAAEKTTKTLGKRKLVLGKKDIVIDTPGSNPSSCWSGNACEPFFAWGQYPGHYSSCVALVSSSSSSSSSSSEGGQVVDQCGQCICHDGNPTCEEDGGQCGCDGNDGAGQCTGGSGDGQGSGAMRVGVRVGRMGMIIMAMMMTVAVMMGLEWVV